jgi:uncharacterized protein YbbK (DUF523 family)
MPDDNPVLVSACLLGFHTRYDGASAQHGYALELLRERLAIPICPEQLAGLPTPRPKITLVGGDGARVAAGDAEIVSEDDLNVTQPILKACNDIVRFALAMGVHSALLKEGSPSCGVSRTNADWRDLEGPGVLAAILSAASIPIRGV